MDEELEIEEDVEEGGWELESPPMLLRQASVKHSDVFQFHLPFTRCIYKLHPLSGQICILGEPVQSDPMFLGVTALGSGTDIDHDQ